MRYKPITANPHVVVGNLREKTPLPASSGDKLGQSNLPKLPAPHFRQEFLQKFLVDTGADIGQILSSLTDHLFGCSRVRKAAYHPSFNGLVGRFHRGLKTSLRDYDNLTHWNEHFPSVMLGIRTSLKPDLECSTAELVYGTALRIPGDFFGPSQTFSDLDATDYVQRLGQAIVNLWAIPPRAPVNSVYKSPQRPYDGPFRVLSRTEKRFKIVRGDHTEVVLPIGWRWPILTLHRPPQKISLLHLPKCLLRSPRLRFHHITLFILLSSQFHPTTRSSRRVRFPDRYQLVHHA
nr:unnamed protein product [Spirometra erinaceieuropaei]